MTVYCLSAEHSNQWRLSHNDFGAGPRSSHLELTGLLVDSPGASAWPIISYLYFVIRMELARGTTASHCYRCSTAPSTQSICISSRQYTCNASQSVLHLSRQSMYSRAHTCVPTWPHACTHMQPCTDACMHPHATMHTCICMQWSGTPQVHQMDPQRPPVRAYVPYCAVPYNDLPCRAIFCSAVVWCVHLWA